MPVFSRSILSTCLLLLAVVFAAMHMESLPTGPAVAYRLLITVHGIRTFGLWQEKLEHKLREEPGRTVEVCHYRYGFFTVLAFLIPPFRWLATRRFRAELLHQSN